MKVQTNESHQRDTFYSPHFNTHAPHLHSSVARAHHTSTGGVHLGQVVEGQDVARLRGQVEEFQCLLVVTLHTNAI